MLSFLGFACQFLSLQKLLKYQAMIGSTIIELASIGSTNSYASELFAGGNFDDGTVVWAHEQFAGRGQHDHVWSSESGKNLTFTVCLKPGFLPPEQQFQLNKAVTLGILDFLNEAISSPSRATRHTSRIKWPNDLYIDDKKIGGILIENRIMGTKLAASFVGIGLNINQVHFPPDVPAPVSLIHMLAHEVDLKDALNRLCGLLDNRYQALFRGEVQPLDLAYVQNLKGVEEWRNYVIGGCQQEGKIKGVDSSGCLLVEDRGGRVTAYGHGEIVSGEW